MAPKIDLKSTIDRDLAALFFELDDLREAADHWDEEHESYKYDVEMTWHATDLPILRDHLDPAYRAGQMTAEQQARYRELLGRLKEALPILDRLGFSHPPVSLDLAA